MEETKRREKACIILTGRTLELIEREKEIDCRSSLTNTVCALIKEASDERDRRRGGNGQLEKSSRTKPAAVGSKKQEAGI